MSGSVGINHLGYKQYFSPEVHTAQYDIDSEEQCISCHASYINTGEGILCDKCDLELPSDEHTAFTAHDC